MVAKRQMSLWTEKEKTAFIEAYKVPSSAVEYAAVNRTLLIGLPNQKAFCQS